MIAMKVRKKTCITYCNTGRQEICPDDEQLEKVESSLCIRFVNVIVNVEAHN